MAGKKGIKRTSIGLKNLDELKEKIRHVAQGLYEKRGRVSGHELDDWLEAERLVKSGSK